MFVSYEDYVKYGTKNLTEDDASIFLNKAERQINTLCQNRIFNGSITKYMEISQNIVKQIICEQAEYLFENEDEINKGTIKSYSNNGASITYNTNVSVITVAGVTIKADLYSQLTQTGLCYRGIL